MKTLRNLLMIVVVAAVATACSFTYPVNATSNPVGNKVGTSSGKVILGIFYKNVDTSIKSAAKNGKISKISTVDFKVENKIFVHKYTCIVTGE